MKYITEVIAYSHSHDCRYNNACLAKVSVNEERSFISAERWTNCMDPTSAHTRPAHYSLRTFITQIGQMVAYSIHYILTRIDATQLLLFRRSVLCELDIDWEVYILSFIRVLFGLLFMYVKKLFVYISNILVIIYGSLNL